MTNNPIDNCKLIAEEVAYSAKGHFKTADSMKFATAILIIVPLLTSLVAFAFQMPDWISRTLGFFGLVFSSLALYSALTNNPQKSEKAMSDHMALGNEYLAIYKEIRASCLSVEVVSSVQVEEWNARIANLDKKSSDLPISWMGYVLTRLKVDKEMDMHWLRQ